MNNGKFDLIKRKYVNDLCIKTFGINLKQINMVNVKL